MPLKSPKVRCGGDLWVICLPLTPYRWRSLSLDGSQSPGELATISRWEIRSKPCAGLTGDTSPCRCQVYFCVSVTGAEPAPSKNREKSYLKRQQDHFPFETHADDGVLPQALLGIEVPLSELSYLELYASPPPLPLLQVQRTENVQNWAKTEIKGDDRVRCVTTDICMSENHCIVQNLPVTADTMGENGIRVT